MVVRITLRDVISHMQVHAGEFRKGFLMVHKRIDDLEKKLTHRTDSLEKRLLREIRGVDDLDFRVQAIEEEDLPQRVKNIEKKLQLQQ